VFLAEAFNCRQPGVALGGQVSRGLDERFRSLGSRIRDPTAFTEPGGLPAKVAEALCQAARVEAAGEAQQ
jgi:hypothetical protein